ncbi:MAG: hypothetical protein FWC38_02235 [Proteobacteria bacterium]|nr:hypothetical protein [Pseudomonadota bacterium]MCL2307056.1 hypothetical protein [Pseudomonadota bacterium]
MSKKRNRSPLLRFVLITFAWLPLMFAIWYFAAPILIFPAKLLAEVFTQIAFGDLVKQVLMESRDLVFVTSLRPGEAMPNNAVVSVEVNALLYSFGLPMLAALVLAAREKGGWKKLLIGYLVIVPFITWGVTADFLKNVNFTAGPFVAAQVGFSALQRELVAFAYQFGTLILPTVVPAIVWVLTHRNFLERIRGQMNAIDRDQRSGIRDQ